MLAADLADDDGGVDGRPIELRSLDVGTADAAPGRGRPNSTPKASTW